jgi:hypothetical protein
MKKLILTSIIFCSITLTTFGQKGYLRGKILDGETGEELIGATISKQGTSIGTAADFNGSFSLSLEPGVHTIIFQFVSYQTKIVENVEITADKVTTLDIALGADVEQLAEVIIQAEAIKDSEVALLTLQKKSANVTDGISAQSFRKAGDSNLSNAMKRVTGVSVQGGKYVYVRGLGDRYTRTTLNGMSIPGLDPERNDVQIDLFPTSVLENVIVYKTFSPELAGDFTGGTVDVETKSFPEEKFTRVSFGVGYNPKMNLNNDFLSYDGGNLDFLGFDDGSRELPISDPEGGVPRPTQNPVQLEEVTKKLEPQMATKKQRSFLNTNFSINHGNQIDKGKYTVGYGAVFNYQNQYQYYDNTASSLYFKDINPDVTNLDAQKIREGELGTNNVLWSTLLTGAIKYHNNELGLRIFRTQNAISQASKLNTNDLEETGQTIHEDILTYTQRSITSTTLYGKHRLNNLSLTWSNAFTIARVYDPDFRATAIAEIPQFNGGVEQGPTYSIDGGDGGSVRRFWRDLNEYNENFRLDAIYDLSENNKLKFGTSGLLKWRNFETSAFQLSNKGIVENDADFLLEPENIWDADTRTGTYLVGDYEAANNYKARSTVFSGYIMNDVFLTKKFRAIYGVRLEQANVFYTGQNNLGTLVYNDQKTLNELSVLPSLNLVYSLNENINLRSSYGRTLARPSFREKSIAQVLDPISGVTYNGNIDLNQTSIDNFDFRVENFFGGGEMVALSGFYKRFDGHIEQVRYQVAIREVTWQNIGKSEVFGLEFEFRKNLNFINGLSVGSNVSLAKSVVDINDIIVFEDKLTGEKTTEYQSRLAEARTGETVEDTRPMAGQAPYLLNGYLNYADKNGFNNINLSYNVQGESLSIVGVGQVPDVYVKPFHSLNFNASRKLGHGKNSQVTFGIDNILGSVKREIWKNYEASEVLSSRLDGGQTFSVKYSYTF